MLAEPLRDPYCQSQLQRKAIIRLPQSFHAHIETVPLASDFHAMPVPSVFIHAASMVVDSGDHAPLTSEMGSRFFDVQVLNGHRGGAGRNPVGHALVCLVDLVVLIVVVAPLLRRERPVNRGERQSMAGKCI